MHVPIDEAIRYFDGKEIVEDGKVLTLGAVIVNSLLSPPAAGQNGEAKIRQYDLALRVYHGENDYTAEEVSEMKRCIKVSAPTLVAGQALRMIDGQDTGIEVAHG